MEQLRSECALWLTTAAFFISSCAWIPTLLGSTAVRERSELQDAPTPSPALASATAGLGPSPTSQPQAAWDVLNVDGFACAAAVAINLGAITSGRGTEREIHCTDLVPSFRESAEAERYSSVAEWFVSETNLFLRDNSLPFELQRKQGATADDLITGLEEGTPVVAVVSTPHLVHAVVIVGYHRTDGFAYLDSLRQGDDMPFAADFLADYGVDFQEAWTDTFILVETLD